MKTRWKILIIALVFVVVSIGITLMTIRVGPANDVEAYKNTLRAQGEKLEISEVAPPVVSSDQNGRDPAQMGFNSLGSTRYSHYADVMWMVAPGKAIAAWSQPESRGSDYTNSWEDFATDVAVDAPAIDSLHQAAQFPKLDFGLDYQKGPTLLLPHLAQFKHSAFALVLASTLALHQGDTPSAATNLCDLLHLVAANEDECIMISDLVRIAMTYIAVGGTWDFLQATNLTDAELANLQRSWSDLHFVQPAEKAMLMERAIMPAWIEKARASSAAFDSAFGWGGSSGSGPLGDARAAVGKTLWRASWSYSQELYTFRCDQVAIQTLRNMQTNQCWKTNYDTLDARLSKIPLDFPGKNFFEKLEIPTYEEAVGGNGAFESFVLKTIRAEAARRIVITAIAFKRYQLQHGSLPDNLSQLCPGLLPAVPLDPIDGNPLRYRKNDDGTYLLYSIGEDGVDDGGDPTYSGPGNPSNFYWQNNRARDWVWPQPATSAEIQAYWATNAATLK